MKKRTIKSLRRELWKWFSLYIRLRDKGICFTCGKTKHKKGAYHAGHFYPKRMGGLLLYFNEDAVHGQCARCNLSLQGNQYIYGQKLGAGKAQELLTLAEADDINPKQYPWELKIAYYKQACKELALKNKVR